MIILNHRFLCSIILGVALGITSCVPENITWSDEPSSDYLTVQEVRENYKTLEGNEVRVCGWAYFFIKRTLLACKPHTCDCNETEGVLWLTEEQEVLDYENAVQVSLPGCSGDECSITCKLFDPSKAEAFEFVGTLTVCAEGCDPLHITIEDIDLAQSKQLIDNNWESIPIGDFVIPLGKPTISP